MSKTISLTTIISALEKTKDITTTVNFKVINSNQEKFILLSDRHANEIKNIDGIESWLKSSAEEINRILKERGFDIRLEQIPGPSFYLLSILDILLNWHEPAFEVKIKEKYDASRHSKFNIDSCVMLEGFEDILVRLKTTQGGTINLMKFPEPEDEFELIDIVDKISNAKEISKLHFDTVDVPHVLLDIQPDISWLEGLSTEFAGDEITVAKALQQIIFAMNQNGVRAKEATAISMMVGALPNTELKRYYFDSAFLLWYEIPGIDIPIFQSWIDERDWKNPGELETI